jgi:rod shape-determining protein MreC
MPTSRDDFGIAIRSALLQRGARQKFSLFFLISLALVIFFLETYNFKFIISLRTVINDGIYRVSSIANSPFELVSNISRETKKIIFVYKENKSLKEENKRLKKNEFKTEFLSNQNSNLEKILKKNANLLGNSVLSKVLLDKDSPYLKSIIINKGSKAGIKKGMPASDGNYLTGRVVETNYLSARILLLNDLNSRIPVTLGEASAVQAILAGQGKQEPILNYLPEQYLPKDGLNVYTSGKDGIFISGMPIGTTIQDGNDIKVKLFSDPDQLSFVTIQLIKVKNKIF